MKTLEQGTIHVPGGTGQDGSRFLHATQNGAQFKTYELFPSGTFHLIFLNRYWLQVTEATESKATGKGGRLYFSKDIQKGTCGAAVRK